MTIRDRIKEFKRVPASSLAPNPKNWRTHPTAQRDALKGVLSEIGYAGALIARELEDGSLIILDGHLRAETTPDQDVPVLVLDVDERESEYLMATLDPLGAMAEANADALAALLEGVSSSNAAVQEMLEQLIPDAEALKTLDTSAQLGDIEYRIIVLCENEQHHAAVLDKLQKEGLECRVLIS